MDSSTNWTFDWPILLATCDFFVNVKWDSIPNVQYWRDQTFQDFYIPIPLVDSQGIANELEAYDNLALNCASRNPKNNANQAIVVNCAATDNGPSETLLEFDQTSLVSSPAYGYEYNTGNVFVHLRIKFGIDYNASYTDHEIWLSCYVEKRAGYSSYYVEDCLDGDEYNSGAGCPFEKFLQWSNWNTVMTNKMPYTTNETENVILDSFWGQAQPFVYTLTVDFPSEANMPDWVFFELETSFTDNGPIW